MTAVAGWTASASNIFRGSQLRPLAPFFPKAGVNTVLLHPSLPTPLDMSSKTGAMGVFLYSGKIPQDLSAGAKVEEGVVYGAKIRCINCVLREPLFNGAPTGSPGDVIKGTLLTWPSSTLKHNLLAADRQWGHMRREVVSVVRKDGSSVKAQYYYQDAADTTSTITANKIVPFERSQGKMQDITQCKVPAALSAGRRALAFLSMGKSSGMLPPNQCIPGQQTPIRQAPAKDAKHYVLKTPLWGPWPEGYEEISLGMGCFWCSESLFWNKQLFPKLQGVYSTQTGYQNGVTLNPTYQDVCTGKTNHNEVTRIIYDPKVTPLKEILKVFWEHHDPTSPNQQGNDRGTQYRSGIYYTTENQKKEAEESKKVYQKLLDDAGYEAITTEIVPAGPFYYAEEYHQQYDAKPGSRQYCGLAPLGVKIPA
eukprot:gb/GEZN01008168.1/.p1 GENE.gb/GEZN01008168.1/~~gb/GEZN01008168.1/.p1  ORF type:complete len:459 (+),score=55.76 gb/GEZN01008168.1/:113-1378(+)